MPERCKRGGRHDEKVRIAKVEPLHEGYARLTKWRYCGKCQEILRTWTEIDKWKAQNGKQGDL